MKVSGITVLLAAGLTAVTISMHPMRSDDSQGTCFSRETWNDDSENTKEVIDPVRDKDKFTAVLYNNQNGLPTSEANDIAETKDGFIWIGSYSGLIRYDGNSFERMDSTTGIANVGCLYVDRKDRLWIGANDSGIALFDKDDIWRWTEEDGLKSLNISEIAQDRKGDIYAGTADGIYIFDEDLNMTAMEDKRVRNMYVEHLLTGSDGEIYGISSDGDMFTIHDGEITSYYRNDDYDIIGVTYLYPDPRDAGKMYLGTQDSTIYHVAKGDHLTVTETFDISPLFGVMGMKEISGKLWVYGRNGIGMLQNGAFHYLGDLPLNNSVCNVMDDYEGNLWFTSTRQGIMKIVPNQFTDLFERYGLESQVVNTTSISDEKLFIGTDTGLIAVNKNEVLNEFPLEAAVSPSGEDLGYSDLLELLNGCRIRSIIRDSQDRLWFSTWRACGLVCYDHGTVTVYTEEDGLISNHIRTVLERKDGSFLVILSGGVNIIRNGRVTGFYGLDEGVVNPEILTVAEAPNGDILLGTDGSGLYIININEELVQSIGTREGLSSGIIMRIKWDEERHVYWIVASNAIAYMTEDYEVHTIRKFPYSNNFDLYENSNEDMWVLSSNGIYVVPISQLLENEEITPIHYSMDNGLPCITTANSYSELTKDGDLYIAGNTGAAKVNIEKPLENVIDLKMGVAYIDADGKRYYPDENGEFYLPAKIHKLTVDSHVYNYALTNPIVEYCLEGFDTEFTTISRSDLGPLDYTNLPGGNYDFVLQLKDSQNRVGKRVSFPIHIEKALYEQTWFYVFATLGGLILVTALTGLYIRKKTREMEQQSREEVLKERLNTELKTAGQIQESMLPHTFPPFPDRSEFDLYASMNPAREVGGDFYDFFMIDEDHLCLIIADVSGKGIPASLFMVLSKSILHSYAMAGMSAAEILTKTNETLCANDHVDMFVTVWIGILEIHTGKITAANGGHEYPAVKKDGKFTLMQDVHGLVVGGIEHIKYKEYEFQLEPGDKLFVYTDGVPEATDSENNLFGTDRMLEALNRRPEEPPKVILETVKEAIGEFVKDAEQFDDLTMLCIEYKGTQGK